MPDGALWLGERLGGTISIDPFTQDRIYDGFSLDNIHVIDNVTRLDRLLITYQLQSGLIADDTDGDRIMWPVQLGVGFYPAPDGEITWEPGILGGEASWRETARWLPQNVARTGVPSTMYTAAPFAQINIGAHRIIRDKTVAQLFIGFGYIDGDSTITAPQFMPAPVTGWMQVDYLLSNARL